MMIRATKLMVIGLTATACVLALSAAPAPPQEPLGRSDPVCIGWDKGWVVYRCSLEKGEWSSWKSPQAALPSFKALSAVGPRAAVVLNPDAKCSGWLFDLQACKWVPIPESPVSGHKGIKDRISVAFVEDRVVVWGLTAGPPQGAVLDTKSLKWKAVADAPVAPRYRCPHAVIGKKLLVWGGYGPTGPKSIGPLEDGAVYDPERDSWEKLPGAPLAFGKVGYGMAWGTWGDRFFLVGGEGQRAGAVYDPDSKAWEDMAAPPLDVGVNSACAVSGDRLFLWSGSGATAANGAVYDFRKRKWENVPEAPVSSRPLGFAQANGQQVVVWGGWSDGHPMTFFRDGAVFDLEKQKWQKIPDLPGDVPPALHPGW